MLAIYDRGLPELPDLTVYLENLAARIANKTPKRLTLAHFEFESGTLALTEAGTKRRASLHLVQDKRARRPSAALIDELG
ncbi:MAG TPA: hypothetical protein VFZ81_14925 [Burkholderiales bacterium]